MGAPRLSCQSISYLNAGYPSASTPSRAIAWLGSAGFCLSWELCYASQARQSYRRKRSRSKNGYGNCLPGGLAELVNGKDMSS